MLLAYARSATASARRKIDCTLVQLEAQGEGLRWIYVCTPSLCIPFGNARLLLPANTGFGPNSVLKGSESRQFDRQVMPCVEYLERSIARDHQPRHLIFLLIPPLDVAVTRDIRERARHPPKK